MNLPPLFEEKEEGGGVPFLKSEKACVVQKRIKSEKVQIRFYFLSTSINKRGLEHIAKRKTRLHIFSELEVKSVRRHRHRAEMLNKKRRYLAQVEVEIASRCLGDRISCRTQDDVGHKKQPNENGAKIKVGCWVLLFFDETTFMLRKPYGLGDVDKRLDIL